MLSRHGIWYYRKVNVLPCGKRREFRRSLGTRSKTEATKRSLRFADRPWLSTETATTTIDLIQSPHSDLSLSELKLHAEQYVEFKSREVCEREVSSIKRCIDKYFSCTGFAPIFPDTCYHLTHYWPAAADIPVASDN
ncbi:hypothetical protein L1Q52_27875, partial [Klebsiella pneumoniae]